MTIRSDSDKPSQRIIRFINALPVTPEMRVLEIGCGPGSAAREVCRRIGDGYVLVIDRSEQAIRLALAGSSDAIASGRLAFLQVAIEDFELPSDIAPFDLAFAMRVGALDDRYPAVGKRALVRIQHALKPGGRLFVDTGDPLGEIDLTP